MKPELVVVNLFLTTIFHLILISGVNSHGRLLEPPNRSSLWRFREFDHLNPPKNYDDNGINCGGFWFQHEQQGGKCGECGDPYNQRRPRSNEGGGKFGQGIIVRNYTVGQEVEVLVELTANHKGYFEFRLCPHNNPTVPVNQDCLDQHVLFLSDGSGTKYNVDSGSIFEIKLQLPEGIRCSQCVLQWHYTAGNNWGDGPQENFRNCADIAIF